MAIASAYFLILAPPLLVITLFWLLWQQRRRTRLSVMLLAVALAVSAYAGYFVAGHLLERWMMSTCPECSVGSLEGLPLTN